MTWIAWLALALGVVLAAVFGLAALGASRWTDATDALMGKLEATRLPAPSSRYDERELEGLPAPLQRYFRAVLKNGQRIVTAVTVEHTGTFNVSPTGERWLPFTSRQRVVTRRPGFLWNAHMNIVPGVPLRVHDAYVGGEGTLRVAALGLFPIADVHGPGEIAKGELMRFLAEAAWYPTALLPSQGVRWEAVDDRSANATLVDGKIGVTLLFRFNDAGLMESARAEERGAAVGKTVVMLPWEVRTSNYAERDGLRVPLTGEAAWVQPQGLKPYWRGTIVALAYEFAP